MKIETYNLPHDLKVFGFQVKTFPDDIGDAFDALMKMIPAGKARSYFGISKFDKGGNILYYATAEETFDNEAKKYHGETFVLKKGEYLTVAIHDWHKKIDSIKNVFDIMLKDERVDRSEPCIEWYKSDDEMLCIIKKEPSKDTTSAKIRSTSQSNNKKNMLK